MTTRPLIKFLGCSRTSGISCRSIVLTFPGFTKHTGGTEPTHSPVINVDEDDDYSDDDDDDNHDGAEMQKASSMSSALLLFFHKLC